MIFDRKTVNPFAFRLFHSALSWLCPLMEELNLTLAA